jgi:hypothetical protein
MPLLDVKRPALSRAAARPGTHRNPPLPPSSRRLQTDRTEVILILRKCMTDKYAAGPGAFG